MIKEAKYNIVNQLCFNFKKKQKFIGNVSELK